MIGLAMMLSAVWMPSNFQTGDQLYKMCTGTADDQRLCAAYLTGAIDAATSMPRNEICLPAGTLGRELKAVVVTYINANPDARIFSGGSAAIDAFRDKYRCPSG